MGGAGAAAVSPTGTSGVTPSQSAPPAVALRRQVRSKDGWLLAVSPTEIGQIVRLPDGLLHQVRAEHLLVYSGAILVDVCTEATLRAKYDVRDEGGLSLSGEERRALEDRLGTGTTQDATRLVAAVARLAQLQIGSIEITLTPGQWSEIAHRAGKNGRTVDHELQQVVQRLEDELFHGGVPRSAAGRV